MKKTIFIFVALLLLLCWSFALADECKYAGQGSGCEPGWWVDAENRLHCRACFYHVEDKEDMNSHVQITPWEACTVDEKSGECAVCGWDYVKDSEFDDPEAYEKLMLEVFYVVTEMRGSAPVEGTVSGNRLSLSFTKDYITFFEDCGFPVSESIMVETVYTMELPQGSVFPYTGEAIEPPLALPSTEFGPGPWLEKYWLLSLGDVVFENNVEPGTASASVPVTVEGGETYMLTVTFTITDEPAERYPGDANGDGAIDLYDAFFILNSCVGENVSITNQNADVNNDQQVDLYDALCILQHEAGWGVNLQ